MAIKVRTERIETVTDISELFENGIINLPLLYKGCSSCPHFGSRWACPPFDFDLHSLWKSFTKLRVIAVKAVTDADLRTQKIAPEDYESFCGELLAPYKRELHSDLLRLERDTPGSRAISPGSCDSCALPCPRANGLPCKRADMRPTLEALGADVSRLAGEYLHTELLWLKNGILPEYFVLVGGLLTV